MLPALLLTALLQAQKLAPGSPAPALAVELWPAGRAPALGAGKIVVLDFWAPGNEQCRASQPYLSELARELGPRGVEVAGVTGPDERTTLESLQRYLAEHATTLRYAVGWDAAGKAKTAFVGAAGQRPLPCSFVLDARGTVAWIGNPMFAVEPVSELLAGTWDMSTDPAALAADEAELLTLYGLASVDPKGVLAKLAAFEQKRPRLSALTEPLRFELALATGEFVLASATGNALLEHAGRVGDAGALQTLAWRIVDPDRKVAQPDLELARRAGEKAVELTEAKDYRALETLAHVFRARGDKARALELFTQAIQVAPPLAKASLLETLQALEEK